jgi:hypothetical protein
VLLPPLVNKGLASAVKDSLSLCFLVLWIFVTGFIFSMFSGLVYEKSLFRPFVFKQFSGLGVFLVSGQEAAMQLGGVEAGQST